MKRFLDYNFNLLEFLGFLFNLIFFAGFIIFYSNYSLLFLATSLLFWIFYFYPKIGLLLSIATLSVFGLSIDFLGFSIPLTKYLSVILGFAFGFRSLVLICKKEKKLSDIKLSYIIPFLLFFAVQIYGVLFQAGDIFYFLKFIIFSYFAYIALPVNIIQDKNDFIKLLKIYFFSMGIVAFFYLVYFVFNFILTSEFAFILNLEDQFIFPVVYLFFGEQTVLSIASGLILYDMAKSSEIKKIITFFIVCLFISNLFVFSRATLISALFIFAVRYIFTRDNNKIDLSLKNIKKYIKKSLIVFLVFITLYFSYFKVIETVRFYRNSISSSSEARADFISEGIRVFKENPILGYGPGSNKEVTNSYLIQIRYGGASDAHSIFQSLLVETGVIGFLIFMYIILSISHRLYKNMKNNESLYDNRIYFNLLVLLFVAFLMQIVSVNYYTDKLIFPIGLCIIYLEINKKYEKNIGYSLH
ncbi:hypothetical protein EOM09_02465 [bacterium]|nr:hypothetical protein [bacterium]